MNKCKMIKENITFSRLSIIKEVLNKESKAVKNPIPAFKTCYKAVVIIVACFDLQTTTKATTTNLLVKDDRLPRNVFPYL